MRWRIRRWVRKWWYLLTGRPEKLLATFTFEHIDDLKAAHGFDIEDEIVKAMSQAICDEIDEEIMNSIYFDEAWRERMPRRKHYLEIKKANGK